MSGTFLLARRHVWHHRGRSLVLIACLTLTFSMPLGMQIFTAHVESRLTVRASSTPLVIGAAGSRFDLALHGLYFRAKPPRETTMREVNRVSDSGFAKAIPLFVRFKAQGIPIVGTTGDYIVNRNLRVASGKKWSRYGDCLIGSKVARRLNLAPGDSLMSDPENVFDLDGSFPLKMRVTGILAESNSPDDAAVFVDIYTTWIIAGIGHGHPISKPSVTDDTSEKPLHKNADSEDSPTHDASLIEYTEITAGNARSFHFHGKPDQFPVSAILAFPDDEEAETLLMGRYLNDDDPAQVLRPVEVVNELMTFVFQLRRVFLVAFMIMASITVAMLMLLILLTIKLRKREFETMFRLGGSRFLIAKLVGNELFILFCCGGLLTCVVLAGLAMSLSQLSFAG